MAASKTETGGGGGSAAASAASAADSSSNRSNSNSNKSNSRGLADDRQRFEGFQLFPRQEEADGELDGGVILATFTLPNGSEVVTKEASLRRGRGGRPTVTLQQLFAHRVHGVDNTGNVRVWPAEQVLLHVLLNGPLASSLEGSRVLELGAGKTGLAGLGVAACSGAAGVVITDGNPDALRNLEACVELNAKKSVFGNTKVSARRLMWDSLDRDGDTAALCDSHPGGFDLIIASDCLFFKDFHGDLKYTIETLLAPNGRAILVQPQRGGTVDLFMRRIARTEGPPSKSSSSDIGETEGGGEEKRYVLEARLLERYDERIWNMHREYLESSGHRDGRSAATTSGSGFPSEADGFGIGSNSSSDIHQRAQKTTAVGSDGGFAPPPETSLLIPPSPPLVPPSLTATSTTTSPVAAPDGDTQKPRSSTGASSYHPVGANERRDGVQVERRDYPHPDPTVDTPSDLPEPAERPDQKMKAVYERLAERLRFEVRKRRRQGVVRKGEGGGDGGGGGGGGGFGEGGERQLWVAVAGAPGSGKTTLAAEVCRLVQEEFPAVCVPMDGYHLYRRELAAMPNPEEARRRRGAHWTFDGDRFLREIREARIRGRGSFPGFDHAAGDPVENLWVVEPSHAVVIVEGNYLLLKGVDPWDGASLLFDETWAIRCPSEVCGERVRKRHVNTGIEEGEARLRVERNDLPNAVLVEERCPWHEVDVVIDSGAATGEVALARVRKRRSSHAPEIEGGCIGVGVGEGGGGPPSALKGPASAKEPTKDRKK
eukprot:jgi/Undpi1/12287/HiC_scaffold_5.g01963.m1